jgi:hypothetical protein
MPPSPRSAAVVAVFACACAPASPAPRPAPASEPAATTAPAANPAPPPAREPAVETRVLGLVHRMGDRTCPGGQYGDTFVNTHWAVGLVPLHATPEMELQLEALRGKPALIGGSPEDGPPASARATTPEECPMAQMRSGWIETPDGIVTRRAAPPLRGLKVASIRTWSGLSAAIAGRHVSLHLKPDLGDATLRDAELVVHYEGCYGKPGTAQETFQLGELGPKAGAGAAAPLTTRKGNHDYALASVELRGELEGLHVALDVPLGALGVSPPDCP